MNLMEVYWMSGPSWVVHRLTNESVDLELCTRETCMYVSAFNTESGLIFWY